MMVYRMGIEVAIRISCASTTSPVGTYVDHASQGALLKYDTVLECPSRDRILMENIREVGRGRERVEKRGD